MTILEGKGRVVSDNGAIDCTLGSCWVEVADQTTIALTATGVGSTIKPVWDVQQDATNTGCDVDNSGQIYRTLLSYSPFKDLATLVARLLISTIDYGWRLTGRSSL